MGLWIYSWLMRKQILIGRIDFYRRTPLQHWDTYDDGFWDQGGLLTIKGLTHDLLS